LASGSVTMPSTAIESGACGAIVIVAGGATAKGNRIEWSYSGAPGPADGLLKLNAWVTSGNANFNQCNPTSSTLTPDGVTVNWEVIQ